MTDEQRVRSVAAIIAAARLFHTQAGLASIIGKSTSHVSRLAAGDVEIDAVDAVNIDKRSSGKIPRHELRPDLWDAPKRSAPGLKYWESALSAMPLKTGDTVKVSGTKFFDEQYRVANPAIGRDVEPPAWPAKPATKGTPNGKTRTGKREGKEKASGPQGRARTQGRQGQKAERRKGKGD